MINPPANAERAAFAPLVARNTSATTLVLASCTAANFNARRLPRRALSLTAGDRPRVACLLNPEKLTELPSGQKRRRIIRSVLQCYKEDQGDYSPLTGESSALYPPFVSLP